MQKPKGDLRFKIYDLRINTNSLQRTFINLKSIFLNQKKQRGFTLIELLVTLSILAIISGVGMLYVVSFQSSSDLDGAAGQALGVLREARSDALAGLNNDSWGVRLENTRLILFQGATYGANPSSYKNYLLSDRLTIPAVNINLQPTPGTTIDIVFSKLTGNTANTGSFIIRLTTDQTQFKTININAKGRVWSN